MTQDLYNILSVKDNVIQYCNNMVRDFDIIAGLIKETSYRQMSSYKSKEMPVLIQLLTIERLTIKTDFEQFIKGIEEIKKLNKLQEELNKHFIYDIACAIADYVLPNPVISANRNCVC